VDKGTPNTKIIIVFMNINCTVDVTNLVIKERAKIIETRAKLETISTRRLRHEEM